MSDNSIAALLLQGLPAEERERVVDRLQQAAQDERAAAEAGRPRPFPGPPPPREGGSSAEPAADGDREGVSGAV